MTILLRDARRDELDALSELCLRSKAVWGYDDAFIEACREELSLAPADLDQTLVQVAETDTGAVAVVQVSVEGDEAMLDKLFVDPGSLRSGAGRRLLDWAADAARRGGADHMVIEADPQAAEFYRRMGATDAGHAPSAAIPGRMLPRLVLAL